jgi:hypothetical protein
MCKIEIKKLVPMDLTGDGERDQLIVVGVVEDCSGVKVGLFDHPVSPGDSLDGAQGAVPATILGPNVGAHGVFPADNEKVFTATITLNDTTIIKGDCKEPPGPGIIGVLAACEINPDECRGDFLWDQPIDCEGSECPELSVQVDVSDECSASLSIVVVPFVPGLNISIDFGDGTSETVAIQEGLTVAGVILGQAAVVHVYQAANDTTFQAVVTISGRPECTAEIDIPVRACEGVDCPVTQVRLELDPPVPGFQEGDCLAPGNYTIAAMVDPSGATASFSWSVDGFQAIVGQRDVTAISGNLLTLQLQDSPRSVSVIGAGCRSDGIDLRPCDEVCCPDLEGLTAGCLPRCPAEVRSTTATLTATGTDLDCAEVFAWDFGDGTTSETAQPTTTHTYPRHDRFEAEVAMIRPRQCGRPRLQRAATTVKPCPPPCYCVFLSMATAFLLLGFLSLLPLIACTTDPGTQQMLIITMIGIVVLLAIAWLWWLLDPCCKPTYCEHLRILFWVFSWALVVAGLLVIMQACASAISFGLFYVIIQQILLSFINDAGCEPGAPDIFSWPFPSCR